MELTFFIPDEPVAKGRPRVAMRNGKVHGYTPGKTAKAEWRIEQYVRQSLADTERPVFTGPVSLVCTCLRPPPASLPKRLRGVGQPVTRPDLGNYLTLIMDALNRTGVWRDDAQVCHLTALKAYAWPGREPGPGWKIEIMDMDVPSMGDPHTHFEVQRGQVIGSSGSPPRTAA
jgi:Holliday junction resolvase RusA-like endonuclease